MNTKAEEESLMHSWCVAIKCVLHSLSLSYSLIKIDYCSFLVAAAAAAATIYVLQHRGGRAVRKLQHHPALLVTCDVSKKEEYDVGTFECIINFIFIHVTLQPTRMYG